MQGLQKLDMESLEITLLATEAPTDAPEGQRRPIRYANDLAIASDGSIYFTDSADIGPALNAAGFYDTMIGYLQIRAQVWLLTGSTTLAVLRNRLLCECHVCCRSDSWHEIYKLKLRIMCFQQYPQGLANLMVFKTVSQDTLHLKKCRPIITAAVVLCTTQWIATYLSACAAG